VKRAARSLQSARQAGFWEGPKRSRHQARGGRNGQNPIALPGNPKNAAEARLFALQKCVIDLPLWVGLQDLIM
jgi:hypothetical protein